MNPLCPIENLRVESITRLITPNELKEKLPPTDDACRTVASGREAVRAVLKRRDPRLLVITGPCSIHEIGRASCRERVCLYV